MVQFDFKSQIKDQSVPLVNRNSEQILFRNFCYKKSRSRVIKRNTFLGTKHNSSQIAHKGLNCFARNSERGTNGSTLTLKDHFVPYFFIKKHVPLFIKSNTLLGTKYNSSQNTHKELNYSARSSEPGTNGSTLTLKDHFGPYFFFYKKHVSLLSKGTRF